MFNINVTSIPNTLGVHRHTNALIDFINRFLALNMPEFNCFLAASDIKNRDSVFVKLVQYSENIEYKIWQYVVKFPILPDASLKIENTMRNLVDLINQEDDKYHAVINLRDISVDLKAIELKGR